MIRVFGLLILLLLPLTAQRVSLALQEQIYQARDRVLPALVHVEPIKKVYMRGEEQRTLVTGSGVIFSPEGYVMTNDHVAGNAEKVWCTLSNKERITASVIGSDPSTDIAVLKLNLEELKDSKITFARLGSSDSLQVGQIVLALGSPLGLSRSVSMGVVSSIDRYFPDRGSMISPFNLWIQTDAAINPGNSGGPLINLAGRVIGINARAVFLADNLGFAIPINLARNVAEEIIVGSSVQRAWIGLDFRPLKEYRDYLDMPNLTGAMIANVDPNGPAAAAGIRPGDVLQEIMNRPVTAVFQEDLPDVRKMISELPIEQAVVLKVWRAGKTLDLKMTTIAQPFNDEPEFDGTQWGVVIKNLSEHIYQIQMLDDFEGVYVTSVRPGSLSEKANLRTGDVIHRINGEKIVDSANFQEIYLTAIENPEQPVYLEMIRSGYPYFAVLTFKPAP